MIDLTPLFLAVRQAATLCHEVQQRQIVRNEKAGYEPVTIADYGSQAIICRALQTYFPDDAVLSEESGAQFMTLVSPDQRAWIAQLTGTILGMPVQEDDIAAWLDHGKDRETAQLWVIDPIDGTKGFMAQRHYVVALGLMHNRYPVGGIIAAPEYPGRFPGGALLHAIEGATFIEPLHEGGQAQREQVRVSTNASLESWRALESVDKSHGALEEMARVRMAAGMNPDLVEKADSMEKYARIAAGDAELYMRLPRRNSTRPHAIWDHAPGAALVEAAGGKVTDVDGSPLDYSEGSALKNHGIIVSNGLMHDHIIEAVQKILNEDA
ncbi:MAG: 3'(2'),5'-bisphosphate nucleotidase [Anaerolineae bacterium]